MNFADRLKMKLPVYWIQPQEDIATDDIHHISYILVLTHGDGFGVKRIRLTLSLNRCSLFLHVFQRAVCDNYDTKRQHLFFAAPPSRR